MVEFLATLILIITYVVCGLLSIHFFVWIDLFDEDNDFAASLIFIYWWIAIPVSIVVGVGICGAKLYRIIKNL